MVGSVRSTPWLSLCLALACGGSDERAPVEVVRGFLDPPGGVAIAGTWRFEDGSSLAGVQVSPVPVAGTGPVKVELEGHGLCGGRVGLLAPRAAAHQEVYRARPLDYGDDPRTVWAELAGGDGAQSVELSLARPFHPRRAVVVFEQACGGAPIPVVEGARGEALVDGVPLVGGRALLGTVEVAREPTHVVAGRGDVEVDGRRDEAVWNRAGLALVTSLDGEPVREPKTTVWFAWDEHALYVAADIADPDIWSEFGEQDDPLYRQEAFEVFVAGEDPDDGYLEFQVSARNVTFDAHFPSYRKGDESWDGAWTTAVQVRGSVNERGDRDEGWTVEAAIPWADVCERTGVRCPVNADQRLRVNAFRLEKPDRKRQEGYALSPTLVPDFHAWKNAATLGLEG